MRKTLRIKITVAGAPAEPCTRLAVSAHIRLRKAHLVLREALGAVGLHYYCFMQDGRIFANPALQDDYVEDDSTYSLGYCLCLPGHTVDYLLGPTRYTVELEGIEVAAAGSGVSERPRTNQRLH